MSEKPQADPAAPASAPAQPDQTQQTMQALLALVQQLQSSQAALQQQMQFMQQQSAVFTPTEGSVDQLRTDVLYARIKPYDPKHGCYRQRQYTPELKKVCQGGTGEPGDVPIWYVIPLHLKDKLLRYMQKASDPRSERVFDVVTAVDRVQIDRAEEYYRASRPIRDPGKKTTRARVVDTTAPTAPPPAPPPVRTAILPGAQAFMPKQQAAAPQAIQAPLAYQMTPVAPVPLPPQAAQLPTALAGRAAALQDLPPVAAPPQAQRQQRRARRASETEVEKQANQPIDLSSGFSINVSDAEGNATVSSSDPEINEIAAQATHLEKAVIKTRVMDLDEAVETGEMRPAGPSGED